MSIRIYNSLKREKEEFSPLKEDRVTMYVCGPTVYDEPHIGHARSAYIFDVIRNWLTYRYKNVAFVRNVTDVDDKIIEKAKREFPDEKDLNKATYSVSKKYLDSYHEAMSVLGIKPPTYEPKATEYIDKMVLFIDELVKRGVAYVSDKSVYFDIKKAKDYGKLSNQSLENMESGSRVLPDEKKKDPLDFALWKKAKEGEPSWDSPWGKGRPGWHIECSVMSSDILGDEFDIHGGGMDLIFPHHENEVAQSQGLGKKFAQYWIHHGLLTINGQKMAKSLGNFITVDKFMNTHKNADILKLFFLSTHYSHPIDYTEEKIEEARSNCERICIMMKKVDDIFNEKSENEKEKIRSAKFIDTKFGYINGQFEESMDDDFNMPRALAVLQELITNTNIVITQYHQLLTHDVSLQQLYYSRYILLPRMAAVLGLTLKVSEGYLNDEIYLLIEKRNEARKNKDFALSDKIRKQLEEKSIILEDSKDGKTTWRRKI